MAAQKVTTSVMPTKVSGDQFFATEAEAIRQALNQHADLLDNTGFDGIAATADHPAFATAREAVAWLLSQPGLREFVAGQAVRAGSLYLTGTGVWAPRYDFTAAQPPTAGPNWRLVAGFAGQGGNIAAAGITDASEAGRRMLTAADAAAQRALVNNPNIAKDAYGDHPRWVSTDDAQTGLYPWLIRNVLALLSALSAPGGAPSQRPDAPTDGQVDDLGDVWSFRPPAGYSFAQLKIAGLPQTTGAEWLSAANSYVQNGRIYVRIPGAVPAGGLSVYVGVSGNIPDGQALTSNADFRANNVVPTVPGALQVDFRVENASLSPGDTLNFIAKASGGTAPYKHEVQALNPDTGAIVVIGTASTPDFNGAWEKVQPAVYLVTDALTDAAGGSLVSTTRRVVVAAPGSGGGALVPATRTRLGGVRIGDGLAVDLDGLLSADLNFDDLLASDNDWTGINTYKDGIILKQNVPVVIRSYDSGLSFYNQDTYDNVDVEVNDGYFYAAPGPYQSYTALVNAVRAIGEMPGSRILWVQGGLTSYYGYGQARGSIVRPYATLQEAHDAAQPGDVIQVLPGGTSLDAWGRRYYSDEFLWTKNVRIVMPGVIYGGIFQLAKFNDQDPTTIFKRELFGGEFTNRVLMWRHSGGDLRAEITGAKFTGNGNFEVAGGGSFYNEFLSSALLRNCLFDVDITDAALGAVRLTGRDDMGPVGIVLENTRVISVRQATITFRANAASYVTLMGAGTELVGTPPETLLSIPYANQYKESDWLLDRRPAGGQGAPSPGGATYTGSGDIVISAQNEISLRPPLTDPTTAVTFKRNANLPTVSTGTFTADPTGAVRNTVVFIWLGAGATAPDLSNAAFQQEPGAKYEAGKTHRYAFMVGGNGLIQYNITPF